MFMCNMCYVDMCYIDICKLDISDLDILQSGHVVFDIYYLLLPRCASALPGAPFSEFYHFPRLCCSLPFSVFFVFCARWLQPCRACNFQGSS